eukprot:207498-Alexandrium_andersonii.AAC.1
MMVSEQNAVRRWHFRFSTGGARQSCRLPRSFAKAHAQKKFHTAQHVARAKFGQDAVSERVPRSL